MSELHPGDICLLLDFATNKLNKKYGKYIFTEVEIIAEVINPNLCGSSGYRVHAHDGTMFEVTEAVLRMLPVSETATMRLPGSMASITTILGWSPLVKEKRNQVKHGKDQINNRGGS